MEVGLSSADLFKEIIWLGFASEFDLIGRAKTRKIGRYVLTIVLNKTESNGWFCKKQEISSSNSVPLPIKNSFVEIHASFFPWFPHKHTAHSINNCAHFSATCEQLNKSKEPD